MLEREIARIVDNIIESVKRFDGDEILRNMDALEALVGEETAEVIFGKIESMLLGE